jgi:hypothetical protein
MIIQGKNIFKNRNKLTSIMQKMCKHSFYKFEFNDTTNKFEFYYHDILIAEEFGKNKKDSKKNLSQKVLEIIKNDIDFFEICNSK